MKVTKREAVKIYEEWLNEMGAPVKVEKLIGRTPSYEEFCNFEYGTWVRKNDPATFEAGFNEWFQWFCGINAAERNEWFQWFRGVNAERRKKHEGIRYSENC